MGSAVRTPNLQTRMLKVGIVSPSRKELTNVSIPGKQLAHGLGALRHQLQLM